MLHYRLSFVRIALPPVAGF